MTSYVRRDRCAIRHSLAKLWTPRRLAAVIGVAVAFAVACKLPTTEPTPTVHFEVNPCVSPSCEEVPVQRDDIDRIQALKGSLRYGTKIDRSFGTDGRVASVDVSPGDSVTVGQVLAKLEPSTLELRLVEAKMALRRAVEDLERAIAGPTDDELTVSEAEVVLSQSALLGAEQRLAALESGPDLLTLNVLKDKLALAIAENKAASDRLRLLQRGGTSALVKAQARANASTASLAVRSARQAVTNAEANDGAEELAATRAEVARLRLASQSADRRLAELQQRPSSALVAESTVQLAEALAILTGEERDGSTTVSPVATSESQNIQAGPTIYDLKLAQLRTAQAAVTNAERGFRNATIVATFDGTVTDVFARAGQIVRGDAEILRFVGTNVLDMSALVTEREASELTEGQEASVYVDVLGDMALPGAVTRIRALQDRGVSGVVYEVTISSSALGSAGLIEGLSANADVVLERRRDVLLMPLAAIRGTDDDASVQVVSGTNVSTVDIVLGLRNGRVVEISEGLQEGDIIRVRRSNLINFGIR